MVKSEQRKPFPRSYHLLRPFCNHDVLRRPVAADLDARKCSCGLWFRRTEPDGVIKSSLMVLTGQLEFQFKSGDIGLGQRGELVPVELLRGPIAWELLDEWGNFATSSTKGGDTHETHHYAA